MEDKIPMEDYEKVMTALDICACPVDKKTGDVRRCRDCPFNDRGCIVILMMATHEIMKRMKPLVEKAARDGGDGDA